jgi:hypothetical protein
MEIYIHRENYQYVSPSPTYQAVGLYSHCYQNYIIIMHDCATDTETLEVHPKDAHGRAARGHIAIEISTTRP